MSEKKTSRMAQPPLVDKFHQVGKAAFDPDIPENTRSQSQHDYEHLIERYVSPEMSIGKF